MAVNITWLGHSCFTLESAGVRILVDPYLNDSPTSPVKADAVEADYILLTHGHFDHVADAPRIAQRTGATVVSNYEVSQWVKRQGVSENRIEPMNPGGGIRLPFGRVKFTIAHHSSSMPDGSYGGVAGGYVVELDGKRIYFAGDTALFLDMKLIGLGGLDLAVLPIGDRFTMGPDDAVEAIKLLNARQAAPCHYNTWPPIAQDAAKWAEAVTRSTAAKPVVVDPGGAFVV
ncbi:MAG: metal-dependent hydrolase [Pirellulales bacterium]|nr:metal-dependent hydrolase [Pirellulales bacterium]